MFSYDGLLYTKTVHMLSFQNQCILIIITIVKIIIILIIIIIIIIITIVIITHSIMGKDHSFHATIPEYSQWNTSYKAECSETDQ